MQCNAFILAASRFPNCREYSFEICDGASGTPLRSRADRALSQIPKWHLPLASDRLYRFQENTSYVPRYLRIGTCTRCPPKFVIYLISICRPLLRWLSIDHRALLTAYSRVMEWQITHSLGTLTTRERLGSDNIIAVD